MERDTFSNVEPIGRGCYGQVYKAFHNCYKKYYAVKQIPCKHEADFEVKNKEVLILEKLDHPVSILLKSFFSLSIMEGQNMRGCWCTMAKSC